MNILKVIILAIILAPFACYSRPHFVSDIPKKVSDRPHWCQQYHHYLNQQCLLNGGNDEICQDASLRRITLQMGGAKKSCTQNPGPGLTIKKCTKYYEYYMKDCPIIQDKLVVHKPQVKYIVIHDAKQSFSSIPELKRHVILIGLDGARYDAIKKVYQQLVKQQKLNDLIHLITKNGIHSNFFAGGIKGTKSQQNTTSEPGWTSILTGVWVNQHRIVDNSSIEKGRYNSQISTIFNKIKTLYPFAITASLSDWSPIGKIAEFHFDQQKPADINLLFLPNNSAATYIADQDITRKTIQLIKEKNAPTFIFVHFDNPDETGHIDRFSPQSKPYLNAIEKEFVNVNKILRAITKSTKQPWLVIITTDHGGHGFVHGTQRRSDRKVFAIIGAIHGQTPSVKYSTQGQTAFLKIIMGYLG